MASFTSVTASSEPVPISRDEDFIAQALARFHLAAEAESELRRDALDDFQFLVGQQWDSMNLESRGRDSRPCLTMNRLRAFRRMVTNEQRQQRPSIQINPVGDDADVETAEVLQGLCRHVEVNSDADIAYDTGFEHMATGGFGYWRVVTDYVDEDSDEQEIYIKRIRNPFSVYFDPRALEPDYRDAMYCFIVDDMPRELYREEYGDDELAALDEFRSTGDRTTEWITRETIRVAEYFYVELEKRKTGKRPAAVKRTVKWAKINAVKVLDSRDVPCRWIPVVPVLGDDNIVDGKRNLVGMIRDAKDPQRFYNYQISAAAEAIALAPKAPWTVVEGQIDTHELEWEQSNRRNLAVLTYKNVSSANGQPVGAPQRNVSEPPIQAMAMMIRQADNDLKSVTGIYDASLGQQGPEQSGKAVLLRQKQSDIANLNFTDNQARAIKHTGRILLSMFPQVYDVPQVRRIIDPEEAPRMVGVYNSETQDTPDLDELGIDRIFDIGVGRYDVTVSVGPNYQSKRQEAVASQIALISSYPQIMPIAGDLLVRNMDWPGAKQIADRMKKMLPPQLQDQPGDPGAQLSSLQAQAQQLQQHNQVLMAALQQSQQVISQKLVESQSKENTALIDSMTKINVARITASKDRDVAGADRELEMLGMMHDSAHQAASQASDQQHEQGMQASDQQHEQGMQASDQQHEQDMQSSDQQAAAQQPAAAQAQQPGQPAQ